MVEKVKQYCYIELENATRGYNPHPALTRAFGAVMFVLNYSGEEYNEELARWWSDVMRQKFYDLEV